MIIDDIAKHLENIERSAYKKGIKDAESNQLMNKSLCNVF